MLDTELIPAAEADSKWLMMVLHGLGDSMEGYRWLPRALNNPRLNTLLVNAPDDYNGGLRYSHRFAGLIGISGYAHEPDKLVAEQSLVAKEQSFLITHGTADPLLPLAQTKAQMEQLQAADIRMQWEVFEKEHTIQGEAEVAVIRTFVDERIAETAVG